MMSQQQVKKDEFIQAATLVGNVVGQILANVLWDGQEKPRVGSTGKTYTRHGAALYLSISPTTLDRLRKKKQIHPIIDGRLLRFTKKDLDNYRKKHQE